MRLDYFDKLECAKNGFREFQEKENWLRRHWARMNGENGRVQVIRHKRRALSSSLQLDQHRPWSGSGFGAARSRRNYFRNARRNAPARILFRKSLEYEAEDTSELVDENITGPRRVEAKVRVEDRRREREQQSRRCSNRFRKHYEYQPEPEEFMTREKKRSEQQRTWDEDVEV